MTADKVRSTNPKDYQKIPQSMGAMAKYFPDGHVINLHHHARDQLLYAASGVMRLRTSEQAWIVPPQGAVYIPSGTPHAVNMHGDVEMRTLYIEPQNLPQRGPELSVVTVSGLLRQLIIALSEEEVAYSGDSRGDLIARLISMELDRAQKLRLHVPLPRDNRLQKVCAELMADPSDGRTLDDWSQVAGASSRSLARLFERDLGMSFIRWRQLIRFHSALEELSSGQSISKVARNHGYKSTSAFTSAFRKVMGMTPSNVLMRS